MIDESERHGIRFLIDADGEVVNLAEASLESLKGELSDWIERYSSEERRNPSLE
jgi:hypothetical protein